jgi:hypothetical protein
LLRGRIKPLTYIVVILVAVAIGYSAGKASGPGEIVTAAPAVSTPVIETRTVEVPVEKRVEVLVEKAVEVPIITYVDRPTTVYIDKACEAIRLSLADSFMPAAYRDRQTHQNYVLAAKGLIAYPYPDGGPDASGNWPWAAGGPSAAGVIAWNQPQVEKYDALIAFVKSVQAACS